MFSTVLGASAGLLVRTWANGLARKRLLANPWNHVAFAFIGGYIGYNLEGWEKQLLDGVNEKRKERGMPSITRQSLEISALAKEK